MPDTRPGLKFDDNGICYACLHYDEQKKTDWKSRWNELEKLCDKYRGSNDNNYDCAIAVSGGKDSHFQTYIMKEKLGMNPVLLTVGNMDWTETGRKNLENISDAFGCDIIEFHPNRHANRILSRRTFEEIGQPSWYVDSLIYTFPYRMAMQLGIKLLVYGEDVDYTYGGTQMDEKSSAMYQSSNEVVKPFEKNWVDGNDITLEHMQPAIPPSVESCKEFGLDPIYLSYFVPWNSVENYEVAKLWGFHNLEHEYIRECSIDNYDQIDSLSYLVNPYLKYAKYGHSLATDNASRWIRYGTKKREDMIALVEEVDPKLDEGMIDKFCEFTNISRREFYAILDKWYNPNLFEKNEFGVWKPKFKVGMGLVK